MPALSSMVDCMLAVGRRFARCPGRPTANDSSAFFVSSWRIPTDRSGWRSAAYAEAALPARAPKTRHSVSEFEPNRLAPLMLTHALTGRKKPLDRRRAVHVGMDAAHHVVHDRANRNHLLDRIDAHILQAQFPDQWKLLVDDFAKVAQVEMDDCP